MSEEGQQGCLKMKIIEYHDYKTLLGPCFISFSIPLLVPGVVLTIVGSYGNESSFPTFGAWHIVGIIILSFAVLMLTSGILLKCCYRPVISAEIEQHLSPTSSMVTGSKNLGYENEIYCSNNAKMNNKVSHHDLKSSHRVVSTHEAKTTNDANDKNKQFLANGALGEDKKNRQNNRQQEVLQPSSSAETSASGSDNKTRFKNPPPSYEELDSKLKRNNKPGPIVIPESNFTASAASRTMQGQVKVTATIVAEAETTHVSGPRDLSSDGGTEQTTFLPEKKRKKKKRRKRHSNLSKQSEQSVLSTDDPDGATRETSATCETSATGETSARQVLPELRVRPVLVHDSAEHHHQDLHVHFQDENAKETITREVPDNDIKEMSA